MPGLTTQGIQSTTQQYLEIYDITNDMIILKDGSVAMVLTTSSLNFGLLSEEEQDAIIYSYAGLLNSLSFPVEIVIRSQQKDITTYLRYLEETEKANTVPIRKTQIRRYREFIEELVKERNILDKKFYVAIPYTGSSMAVASPVPSVKKKEYVLDKAYIIDRARNDLEPKRDHLMSQFGRIGLIARQLSTQELIHLMYTIYNPGSSEGQEITDTHSYTTPLVEASLKGVMEQAPLQSFTKDQSQG
ncbi:MAG TPA: TraC family protein [Candidatus Saccharimonadia bacterium]|nr:TraC family protein [Candidatus Saccharimonadia bacterium]